MRILIINADYTNFLNSLYRAQPGLEAKSYDAQMGVRNDSLFGVADFYSKNFEALGHTAREIHVNNPWLQYAWAREHGISLPSPPSLQDHDRLRTLQWKLLTRAPRRLWRLLGLPHTSGITGWEGKILAAQIEDFAPDVILNQETFYVRSAFFERTKGRAKLVGQNAAALPAAESYTPYDLMVSSLQNLVDLYRKAGKRAELNRLAFEPSVLDKLGPPPERDIALSFVGNLSPDHTSRIAFLEELVRHTDLQIWGIGIESLPASSPLHARHHGEVWGPSMYNILRRSKITMNKHLDLAGTLANNMRLYEATGMGTLLLTDNQTNLGEIFTPGEHVEAYDDVAGCIAKIDSLLQHEERRARIAAAGQKQACTVHTYFNRCRQLVSLFESLV